MEYSMVWIAIFWYFSAQSAFDFKKQKPEFLRMLRKKKIPVKRTKEGNYQKMFIEIEAMVIPFTTFVILVC